MKIRAVRIYNHEVPHFVSTRCEKDLFPVGRPTWVIGIITRNVFENVNFSGGEIDNCYVPHVRGVARFFDSVKRDASSIRRDRRKNSLNDPFLTGAVEVCDPDSLIALKSYVPIATKN